MTLVVSCGDKKKKSTVKLQIASGAIVNGIPQNGGLVVMGKHKTIDQSFHLDGTAADGHVIELEKGEWDFYAIGWAGNSAPLQALGNPTFGGDIRCNYQTRNLQQEEEFVSFNMNLANCFQKLPPPHDFLPNDPALSVSNNVPTLLISTCQDNDLLSSPAVLGDCPTGTGNHGLGRSFVVKTHFHIGPEDGGGQHMGYLESVCFNVDSDSNLRIPLGDPAKQDGLPGFEIYSFTEANCEGQFVQYRFDGIASGPKSLDQTSHLEIIGSNAVLFLEHNSQTVSDNGGQQNFFFGSGKDGNKTQTVFTGNHEERIIGIDASGTVLTVPGGTATYFSPGDEVMWYVNDCNLGGCSGDLLPGRFNFAHVKETNGSNTVTLHKPIHDAPHYGGQLNYPANLNTLLTVSLPSASAYLSMQLVKVFNFENLDLTAGVTAPDYAHGLGKGGIRAFKVRNELRIDATAAQVFIKATGSGWESNPTLDMSGCGGPADFPCLLMGINNGVQATERGGGILFVSARTLKYSADGGNAVFFKANGDAATTGSITQGGTLLAQFGDVIFNHLGTATAANFTSTQFHSDGDISDVGGNLGGYAKFEYCSATSANAPGGSVPAPATATGATGTVQVDSNPDYCNSL